MVDITLSSDRIRTAPIEVRRWIESELAESLAAPSPMSPHPHHEHLVSCSASELAHVFSVVQGMPPVTNVFLELARDGGRRMPGGVEMHRLSDLAERAHLRSLSQVVACIKII